MREQSSLYAETHLSYTLALDLVTLIDEALRRGVRHYRTRAGVLLSSLDEVVRALLDHSLDEKTLKRIEADATLLLFPPRD